MADRIGGARYYNNKLGVWLSVDPMAHKYAHWSPYNYAANNPLRYLDPHGDTLDVGGNTKMALSYLQSMTDEETAKRLTLSGNRVIFNTDGLDVSSDAALILLDNMVNSKEKFLFEVLNEGDKVYGTLLKDSPLGLAGSEVSEKFSSYGGTANFSQNARNTNGGVGNVGLGASKGYSGQVAIGTGSFLFLDGSPQPTSNIVFHELSENWQRTMMNQPYKRVDGSGAHQDAIENAKNYKKQVGSAGEGQYVSPKK